MSDPISGDEIQAYVDGRLRPDRRRAVQGYLSERPYLAAEVMADLRSRDELRAALSEPELPRPDLLVLAGRLHRRLVMKRVMVESSRGIAALLLVGLGWVLHLQVTMFQMDRYPAPTLVKVLLQAGEALAEAELGFGAHMGRLVRPS